MSLAYFQPSFPIFYIDFSNIFKHFIHYVKLNFNCLLMFSVINLYFFVNGVKSYAAMLILSENMQRCNVGLHLNLKGSE